MSSSNKREGFENNNNNPRSQPTPLSATNFFSPASSGRDNINQSQHQESREPLPNSISTMPVPSRPENNNDNNNAETNTDDWDHQIARLRRFYQQYDPARVPHAEITLRTWKGSYGVMWSKLIAKYGPEPTEAEVTGMTRSISALAAATMAAQKLSPQRNRVFPQTPAPAAYAGKTDYRARLQRFYAKYAPHRLPTVDKALEIFCGKEESLFESLRRKFGEEPAEDFPIPDHAQHNIGNKNNNDLSGDGATGSGGGNNAPYPLGSQAGIITTTTSSATTAAASSSESPAPLYPGLLNLPQMDSSYQDDEQPPPNGRGRPLYRDPAQERQPINLGQLVNLLGGTANGSNDLLQQQQQQDAATGSEKGVDWDSACAPCSDCTECLSECLKSKSMNRFYKVFYPVCFVLAVIGAIVTALILVGVDRNQICFKKTKSTSELDISTLYGPGLYTWGVNTKAVTFPTTLKPITISKDVVCCGGQNLVLAEVFHWTIADKDGQGAVNTTELGAMVNAFGEDISAVISKLVVQAREALSDSVAAWSANMSLDEFLSNRTAIEEIAHRGLIAELRKNKIFVRIPRRYFSLGHIQIPSTYAQQKNQVFANNQSIVTAAFREQATAYRLTTTQKIKDVEANTSLILASARTNATRLKDIAISTNAALSLQNIAYAVSNMSAVVNATTDGAALDLFRLNELLDIVGSHNNTDFFVNIANGKTAFPLV